jgi:hypothetical protein
MDFSTEQTARQLLKSIRHLNNDLKRLVNVYGYRPGTVNTVHRGDEGRRDRNCPVSH